MKSKDVKSRKGSKEFSLSKRLGASLTQSHGPDVIYTIRWEKVIGDLRL